MTDSIRPLLLACPKCRKVIEIQTPRVVSITYTCEGCGALVEQCLISGDATVKKDRAPPPD